MTSSKVSRRALLQQAASLGAAMALPAKGTTESVTDSYEVNRSGFEAASRGKTVELEDNVARFVPPPVRVPSNYRVGAMCCPLWRQEAKRKNWNVLHAYPERTPLLGYYDEGNPEVTDWEIKWALEHGIDFFMSCWFRARGNLGKPVEPILEHWLQGLFQSRYGEQMPFAIMWENTNEIACGVQNEADMLNNLLPYWIEHFFQKPNYLREDGKPVLFIYRPEALVVELGGEANTRLCLNEMRKACERAGLNGLIIFGENHHGRRPEGVDPSAQMAQIGLDYRFSYHWPTFTNHMPHGNPLTAQQIIEAQKQCWLDAESGALPYVLTVSMGWDSRPWGSPFSRATWQLPPADFRKLCEQARSHMSKQRRGSLESRMILVDNWNEFAEGHYIFPTSKYGFGYLNALRGVFSSAPRRHKDILPHDIGLGPYDSLFRASGTL